MEPDGEGCLFTLESEGAFTGPWRILTPLAEVMLRRQSGNDIARLLEILEAGSGR